MLPTPNIIHSITTQTSNTAVDDVFSHTSIQDGSGAATALEYVSMDNGRGKMGPLSAVATASSSSSLPSSNTSNGRVVHSGSGSRQRASNTLQSLTFGALPRSSTDTTNASGVDWVSLVRNGGFPAAANNNNTFGNISNAAAGNNNNNHNSVAGIAATSTNQDNDNDSDSDNHVDHFAIGEKIGMKFIAVSAANHGEKTIAPLLITTNSCGNDNGGLPNVIGAVSSTIDLKIGSKSGWLAMDHGNISKPQPGVSHVVKPNLSYTRTNVGGIPQEKIYYQQQEVNQDETILIDGEKVVIPAGYAIEYCDGKILPLKYDQNLRNEYDSQRKSEITTLVALKDSEVEDSEDGKDDNGTTNYEVLAVLPCSQIIPSVVGKSKYSAVKKTFKGMAYFDGDE